MLMYLRRCLAYSATGGVASSLETTEAMKTEAAHIVKYVRQLLADNPAENGPIGVYINILRQLLNALNGRC